MTGPGSVGADERLRLFFGLPLPDDAACTVERWQQAELGVAGRIVSREHLHVTLAFLGSRPRVELCALLEALRASAERARPPCFSARRYRETLSVGMLVLDDEGGSASALAEDLQRRLELLGVYRRERRSWLAHLTVLRFHTRPRLRPSVPGLAFSPSDAALYHSVLRPSGARYEVIESAALGG
ncbi:MAG: 2'-5' RNA ligase family protein [Gaiellaceae bacterium]